MVRHNIQVVGMGLGGIADLPLQGCQQLHIATLIAGTPRLLAHVPPTYPAQRLPLHNLQSDLKRVEQAWQWGEKVVILVSGDPLFFGLGRLLLQQFPAADLVFHPHLSSVQLAFSRLRLPWQDARLLSVHGRDLEPVRQCCQQGIAKIAILTDAVNNPGAIATLVEQLHLPHHYSFWVCENLGGETEWIQQYKESKALHGQTFAPLSVVVLLRQAAPDAPSPLQGLPLLGLPDNAFLSFADRPGLMTKREIRIAILGELALTAQCQVLWDLGAGTGSVAIEMARLVPQATIYALEKTAMGVNLIEQNCHRLGVENVVAIAGVAPDAFAELPAPDRVFIGGSGGQLLTILAQSWSRLKPQGKWVGAFASLENFCSAWQWCEQQQLAAQVLQLQVARSLPFAQLHRLTPLNPITLLSATKDEG
ncbi:MAG: precorrin-6y C5,15-methyltransferase (decarboxylating) subunit CbiE [Cyanobacteria bacterium P01_G01_bin.54]